MVQTTDSNGNKKPGEWLLDIAVVTHTPVETVYKSRSSSIVADILWAVESEFSTNIHEFCKDLPREELFVLASQMRRASRSIHANIAEAWRKRRYQAAFISKLSDAETEATEMQNWFDFCLRVGYMEQALYEELDSSYESVLSQLVRMIDHADRWCKRN